MSDYSEEYAPQHAKQDHLLSNTAYDQLKKLAQIGLPAAGALYFGLSQIWGLPYGVEVVGTIALVDTFLGILLGYASKSYNDSDAKYDGDLIVAEGSDKRLFTLSLSTAPEDMERKDEVIFKVDNTTDQ